jgi:hypothetical protein
MSSKGLCLAFESWKEGALEKRRERTVIGRVAFRLTSRCAATAFCAWRDDSKEARRNQEVIARNRYALFLFFVHSGDGRRGTGS